MRIPQRLARGSRLNWFQRASQRLDSGATREPAADLGTSHFQPTSRARYHGRAAVCGLRTRYEEILCLSRIWLIRSELALSGGVTMRLSRVPHCLQKLASAGFSDRTSRSASQRDCRSRRKIWRHRDCHVRTSGSASRVVDPPSLARRSRLSRFPEHRKDPIQATREPAVDLDTQHSLTEKPCAARSRAYRPMPIRRNSLLITDKQGSYQF